MSQLRRDGPYIWVTLRRSYTLIRVARLSAPANSTVDAADAAIYHFRNRIGSLETGIPHEDQR